MSNKINDLGGYLTLPRKCPIIVFGIEIRPLLGNTYMADRMNLVVDYEDQADWLQDSIVIENVIMGQDHVQLIQELEKLLLERKLVEHADNIIILSGAPIVEKGHTSLMKLHSIKDNRQ